MRKFESLLWPLAGTLACLLALSQLSGTLAGGIYVPGDADSFYHAHRILDALRAPWHLEQFDPRIHAPEGSWVTWPWAYDMAMAAIGHVAVYDFGVHQPLAVLAYVAPLWTFVNAGLLAAIAGRLQLSPPFKAAVLFCYAASPLTQALHRVGMLDHHYIEYSFVLGTLLCGLGWFQNLADRRKAVALGVVLGMAPAFHNGLFILQVPVLATLGLRWLMGRSTDRYAASGFAGSLVFSTLLFLLPSEPFRRGMFAFELQSWFHLYIACCTGLLACLFATQRRSPGSIALIGLCGVLMVAVIYGQALRAGTFLSGRLVDLVDMTEVKGIFTYLAEGDYWDLSTSYSGLLWLVPLSLAALLYRLRRDASDGALFFVVACLCGATLMTRQYRFENYGSFTLYLPLCLLAQDACRHWPQRARAIGLALCALIAAASIPAYASLRTPLRLGSSYDYESTRAIYPVLARACDERPGVVLADNNDGHPIVYHTRCAVISDNFIMTPQHERKLLETDRLMHSSLAEVLAQAPYVRYILVRRNDNAFDPACTRRPCDANRGLRQELLFGPPPDPGQARLIGELNIRTSDGALAPLARVFEVTQAPSPAAVPASR